MKPLDMVCETASVGILFSCERPLLCHQILKGIHQPKVAEKNLFMSKVQASP